MLCQMLSDRLSFGNLPYVQRRETTPAKGQAAFTPRLAFNRSFRGSLVLAVRVVQPREKKGRKISGQE